MKKFEKAEKFHSLMQEHELDIILVMSPENVFYTTGAMINSSRLIPERLTICIWPALDPPTFLVCDLEKQVAEKESWVKDICLYNEFSQGPIGALVDILKKRGIREGRIGVEGRFVSTWMWSDLSRLPCDCCANRHRGVAEPTATEDL